MTNTHTQTNMVQFQIQCYWCNMLIEIFPAMIGAQQHKRMTCWKPHWWVGRKLGQEVWGSQRWSTRAGRSPPKSRWLSEQKAAHIYYLVLNHPLTFFVAKEKPPDKFFRLGRSATRAIALPAPKFASSLFLFFRILNGPTLNGKFHFKLPFCFSEPLP